jgi:MFS family permease
MDVTSGTSLLGETTMSRRQIAIVGIMFLLNALDGFDVLSISFAAPGMTRAWGLAPASLGMVISLGLMATGFGSLFIAPLADRFGRRPLMLAMIASMAAGMMMCAASHEITLLSIGRVFTGVGVGALVPIISALTAEYANRRYRDFCVMLVAVGFPAGGLIGGAIASALLQHGQWWTVFAAGGAVTSVVFLAPLLFVPESLEFLTTSGASALLRVNAILVKLGKAPLAQLPPRSEAMRLGPRELLLRPALLATTVLVTIVYAAHNATLYYALNWMPKIAVDKSLSQSQAAAIAAWCSGGGVLGSLLAAAMGTKIEIKALTAAMLGAAAITVWAFPRAPADVTSLTAVATLMGAALYGAQVSLYALMARSFPVQLRATGIGVITGVGRVGGIIAPVTAGWLLTAGFDYPQLSAAMATGSIGGALALSVTYLLRKRRESGTA